MNDYLKTSWNLVLWNGDNFRKWGWFEPCPCGCDSREDTKYKKLIGYYSGGFGLFGFTLEKHEIIKGSNWIAESDSFTSNFNRDSYRRYSL
jgi:hypothetical protein